MALKYLIPIDLNSNEIRNVIVHLLGSDPGSPVEGQIWYNTTGHTLKLRLASTTVDLQNPTLLNGQAGSFYLARANHTGTQLASTISDFDTQVRTSRLDQMATPTVDVSWGNKKITNQADPTLPQDSATKNYVDSVATGSVYWKNPVRVASTGNVTISAPGTTIDGVTMVAGDRVGLVAQTTGTENGIYIWNSSGGAMTRATDADTSAEVKSGMAFWVNEGTANADTAWTLTTNDPITLGSTSLTFVQFSGLGQITAGAGLTKSGNILNVVGNAGRIVANADDIDLASGVIGTPGTYRSVTVDTYGRVTAGTNPTAIGKYSALIGDGSSTSITVTAATHGLGAIQSLLCQAYEASSNNMVIVDITVAATGNVTFTFAVAPTSNAIRIVIIG